MTETKDERKKSISRKRAAAGRSGGLATLAKYGAAHFSAIGARGAKVFHSRYKLVPIFQNDFAIVNRETNLTKAFLSGMPLEG